MDRPLLSQLGDLLEFQPIETDVSVSVRQPRRSSPVLGRAAGKSVWPLAIAVLSRPKSFNQRCFQRATLLSLTSQRPFVAGGWQNLRGGSQLFLRYSVTLNDATNSTLAFKLRQELATHGDLLLTPIADGPHGCFHKVIAALSIVSRVSPESPHGKQVRCELISL